MKCLNYHPKHGYGWDYPNTRNDGDPYDCYTIMSKESDAPIAIQHDGVRYAFPAIFREKEMMEYSVKHPNLFGLKPETTPCAGVMQCPICRGDMANTDGSLLRCLSCGHEVALTVEGRVAERIQARAAAGLNKYGVTMERTDLSRLDWLQHAQDEALDLAVYIEKLKGMEVQG